MSLHDIECLRQDIRYKAVSAVAQNYGTRNDLDWNSYEKEKVKKNISTCFSYLIHRVITVERLHRSNPLEEDIKQLKEDVTTFTAKKGKVVECIKKENINDFFSKHLFLENCMLDYFEKEDINDSFLIHPNLVNMRGFTENLETLIFTDWENNYDSFTFCGGMP